MLSMTNALQVSLTQVILTRQLPGAQGMGMPGGMPMMNPMMLMMMQMQQMQQMQKQGAASAAATSGAGASRSSRPSDGRPTFEPDDDDAIDPDVQELCEPRQVQKTCLYNAKVGFKYTNNS